MADLVEIGAPILPPGMFYKIGRPDPMFGMVKFQLREKRRIGSRLLASTIELTRSYNDPDQLIKAGCLNVIMEYEEGVKYSRKVNRIYEFRGSHDANCSCTRS